MAPSPLKLEYLAVILEYFPMSFECFLRNEIMKINVMWWFT